MFCDSRMWSRSRFSLNKEHCDDHILFLGRVLGFGGPFSFDVAFSRYLGGFCRKSGKGIRDSGALGKLPTKVTPKQSLSDQSHY